MMSVQEQPDLYALFGYEPYLVAEQIGCQQPKPAPPLQPFVSFYDSLGLAEMLPAAAEEMPMNIDRTELAVEQAERVRQLGEGVIAAMIRSEQRSLGLHVIFKTAERLVGHETPQTIQHELLAFLAAGGTILPYEDGTYYFKTRPDDAPNKAQPLPPPDVHPEIVLPTSRSSHKSPEAINAAVRRMNKDKGFQQVKEAAMDASGKRKFSTMRRNHLSTSPSRKNPQGKLHGKKVKLEELLKQPPSMNGTVIDRRQQHSQRKQAAAARQQGTTPRSK